MYEKRKKTAIVDDNDCHNALDEYTTWYNNDYTVASLGQGSSSLIFMNKNECCISFLAKSGLIAWLVYVMSAEAGISA
ncbi:hypothetical protein RPO_04285 [Rickettsia rickettsii str. Arizona]|uniref:hypothetical protein n=1 Tax=Rickettsia rickettsii TaxID=783 RepID=UPI00024FA04B|nr:hypothetical protein [Rickettsia rickettsii]AFB25058.1 hypothetical protein RPO_04285 [Rickettsia rickettsii str. Arizona]USD84918.1 hypothetical protein NDY50_04070 [Rickettsia rickettsii]